MKILFVYRKPNMGFSIERALKPVEEEIAKYHQVDVLYMPSNGYGIYDLWRNIRVCKKNVKSVEYDVIHITGTEHYLIPFIKGPKIIVTVHDLGFYSNYRWSVRKLWKYLLWVKPLVKADHMTFISEKSREEALDIIYYPLNKTSIVYNAVSPMFHYFPKTINVKHPIILHLGTKPNKNLNNTILALKGFDCHLRIIGHISKEDRSLLDLYNLDYSNAFDLNDEEILFEYQKCDIVSFPSLYEGFGMPIIEGQATGRVVVTSDRAPMNLVAGSAAILVNPVDVDSIRSGYIAALNHYYDIVKKGLINISRFHVDKIAANYMNVYQNVIGK